MSNNDQTPPPLKNKIKRKSNPNKTHKDNSILADEITFNMQTTNNSNINIYNSNDRTALAHHSFSSASAYTVTMHTDRQEREGGRERVTDNTGGKSDFKRPYEDSWLCDFG